jgi:23S rRNA pseudouridine1911/1915/1917 synthase
MRVDASTTSSGGIWAARIARREHACRRGSPTASCASTAARPAGLRVEDAPLEILHEDAWLVAINKPAGAVAHPGYRHASGTIMNRLAGLARGWPAPSRPSIVGRLDKLTSGVMIAAKTREAHAALQRALTSSAAAKEYLAVVYGKVKWTSGRIDLRVAPDPGDRRRRLASPSVGQESLTRFERLARATASPVGLSLLRCRLVTGRTHQIRVHLAARGWPIVGDPVYGEPRWRDVRDPALSALLAAFPRQALHAWRTSFMHPFTGERLGITAPMPQDLEALIELFEF